MNSAYWAVGLGVLAVVAFIVIPIWGHRYFNPGRARHVKIAERDNVVEHFDDVRRAHPEIVKVGRLDRHPWFVGIHMCVLGYTICVLSGAQLTSNVIALGTGARYTMATCFLIGTTLVLTAATLGGRIGGWAVMPDVAEHLTSSILGDDIVLPYRLSMAGMGAMVVSSGIYSWTSFTSASGTPGSLGGWLTGGVAVLCLISIRQFYGDVARFQKWDAILIADAKIRAGIGEDK